MQIDVDVSGRRVLVVGRYRGSHRVIRRFAAAGARVTAVVEEPATTASFDVPFGVEVTPLPTLDDISARERLIGPAWLVVTVGLQFEDVESIERLARELRVATTTEQPATAQGRVTLVGGGPGATELLTLAAVTALREADVVCFDRLAPSAELASLAPGAELIDVGKTPYHHRISQDRIQDLVIERARRGQSVVRLKGGDPFVFGRGSEELLACTAAGIPVRVVPGVSSAVAVPAIAGIPLTHRGLSHSFTVTSGHVVLTPDEYAALARTGGTLVILMGIANLPAIVGGLRAGGLSDLTPAAVIERAYSDTQRTSFTQLGTLADDARRLGVAAPAVVVVGDVVGLGERASSRFSVAEYTVVTG